MTDPHTLLRRHGLFNAKVPRFTSYPPANRFSDAVTGATVSQWLGATPEGADLSLYVHVPFCRRLCWFCACRTQGTKSDAPLGRYVEALLTEAATIRRLLPVNISVSRLHLGGGTPTILPSPLLSALLDQLNGLFGLRSLDEFSVEIDPMEIDDARIAVLVSRGLTRASIGVQDFDPHVQAAIGRTQPYEDTKACADMLRQSGISALNVDLLYGLPHQTKNSLSRTLDQVLRIAPGRLALYGYAHVPWMSKRQAVIPVDALPEAEARFDLFQHARDRLLSEGFVQIGIDHFARPDDALSRAAADRRLGRSFQGYTDDVIPRLIGLGASAISRFPEGYAQNQPATARYQASVNEALPVTCRGIKLSDRDRARAEVIEHLMCYHSVRLADLTSADDSIAPALAALAAEFDDALTFDGQTLTIQPWAHPLARILAAKLGNTRAEAQTFSTAI